MADGEPAIAPAAGTLDSVLGFEYGEVTDEVAHGSLTVGPEHRQPFGLVHGGVYAALAESLASMATVLAVHSDGNTAMGLSNSTSFMRPVTEGTVSAIARRRHSGRTTWIWDVDFTDEAGRLCASSRVTIAVRPAARA